MNYRSLCIGLLLIATGCVLLNDKSEEGHPAVPEATLKSGIPPLVIVGEGGTSGYLFQYAADTYVKEHGGEKFTVHDGDEFIRAMREFGKKHGTIESFVYFGHGNAVGLYVNQAPHINGGLYANDPIINARFRAASIYDLPRTLFATGSTALFYGCNVAQTDPGLDSFAEQFANHFRTKVRASTGPTEFSFQKDERTLEKLPAKLIDESLYMIPTFSDKGFITLDASPANGAYYDDVHQSMESYTAVAALTKRGLYMGTGSSFFPYQSITPADARAFCKVINPKAACETETLADPETGLVRNTSALKLLLETVNAPVKKSATAYDGEIYFAAQNNLLTHDFTHKRWYSRGDMAILTWNILQMQQ
ncbi:hypothetical protein K8942_02565 [Candidatus Peribacteria bacterium]|nr:MAG: hypothetical protein K8942_02565 [Candidatus Peribacteria bacterium]